jgi:hypothetical protein
VNTVTWEVARAGGLVAYGLLTLSVLLGLVLGLRLGSRRWPRLVTNELHQFVTLATLIFAALHAVAVGIDPFTHFGPSDVLVPFASRYRPLWMGIGIVAFYLAIAVWASTYLRSRIGFRWWRRFHFATFLVYVAATAHGLATGSDTRTAWAAVIYASSAGAVAFLLLRRMLGVDGSRRTLALGAGTTVVVGGLIWSVAGPFQQGWGHHRRVSLPPLPAAVGRDRRARTLPGGAVRTPFAATFRGQLAVGTPNAAGLVTVRIHGALKGGTRDHLEILLHGTPLAGGGVRLAASRVLMGAATPLYQGVISALDGHRIVATLHSGQRTIRLSIVLHIGKRQVVGRITGTRGEPA